MADDSRDERLERLAAQVKAIRQRDIARLLERHEERITQHEEILRQRIEMPRRRDGAQTP
jgi:hypothetical protein